MSLDSQFTLFHSETKHRKVFFLSIFLHFLSLSKFHTEPSVYFSPLVDTFRVLNCIFKFKIKNNWVSGGNGCYQVETLKKCLRIVLKDDRPIMLKSVRPTSAIIRKIITFLRYKEFLHSMVYLKTHSLRDLIVSSKLIDQL